MGSLYSTVSSGGRSSQRGGKSDGYGSSASDKESVDSEVNQLEQLADEAMRQQAFQLNASIYGIQPTNILPDVPIEDSSLDLTDDADTTSVDDSEDRAQNISTLSDDPDDLDGGSPRGGSLAPGANSSTSTSSSSSNGSTALSEGSPGMSLVRMLTGRSSKSADATLTEPPQPESDFGQFKWQKGALLGSGSFGRVHLGLNLDTGELIAVKQVELSTEKLLPEQQVEIRALQSEIGILRNLKHENIVQYLGSSVENNTLNIFLEYVPGGSISSLLRKFGSLPEHLVRLYTKQILQGLRYLHSHKIIHRDIKGANILVDNKGVIKLADFGASKKLEGLVSHGDVASLKGTIYWMAPEVIRQSGYGRQADIWSLGCTVIEMATGRPPWSGEFTEQISALFNIATTNDPPPIPSHLSREARDFLNLCFKRNPRERPTASRLLKHPWITQPVRTAAASPASPSFPPRPFPLPRGSSDSSIQYVQQVMANKAQEAQSVRSPESGAGSSSSSSSSTPNVTPTWSHEGPPRPFPAPGAPKGASGSTPHLLTRSVSSFTGSSALPPHTQPPRFAKKRRSTNAPLSRTRRTEDSSDADTDDDPRPPTKTSSGSESSDSE